MKKLSKVLAVEKLPAVSEFSQDHLLVYDLYLEQIPHVKKWIRSFPFSYGVNAGESLKDIFQFPQHLQKILQMTKSMNSRNLEIIALGGGSVGDFSGFVASIYKRGVRLVQIPSTWLSAIDSSHGGKTALNVADAKNQIGTFYSADRVYLCHELLMGQPLARRQEAFGELFKIALLDSVSWQKDFQKYKDLDTLLWKTLKKAVQAKYKVVKKDPFEISGHRQILNLGHTFGHVLELSQGYPHGYAVTQGLRFALEWSFHRKMLSAQTYKKILQIFEDFGMEDARITHAKEIQKLKTQQVKDLLLKDKKRQGKASVTFIFLKNWGKPVRQSVSVDEMIQEIQRQSWMGKK